MRSCRKLNPFLAAAALISVTITPVVAQSSLSTKKNAVQFSHSSLRLIAGKREAGQIVAALEIKLQPGWKTYWRVPGDSGVPPVFDWKASGNVKDIKVRWPAPKRYHDAAGLAIGYKTEVTFPLQIAAAKSGEPVKLDLKLQYAICNDICVPGTAHLVLDIPAGGFTNRDLATIQTALAKVPSESVKGVEVKNATAQVENKTVFLAVDLDGKLADKTDIFVEGLDDFYFFPPEKVGPGKFRLKADGAEKLSDLTGKSVRLTIVSGEMRVERQVSIR